MFERLESWPEFAALFHELESNWESLAQEAGALVDGPAYTPWHEREIYQGSWDTHGVFWAGQELERKASAPLCKELLGAWRPSVFNAGFSLLRPGALIKPHQGYTSDVIRLHLGLIAPEPDSALCGIQVGDETRGWGEGEILLFDDTQTHSAWNRSDRARIVLLLDLLRPSGREKWRESQSGLEKK